MQNAFPGDVMAVRTRSCAERRVVRTVNGRPLNLCVREDKDKILIPHVTSGFLMFLDGR